MRLQDKNGASAVEFAMVLPLLVMLVFGIIEFSLALYDKAVITNASREGARAAIVFRHPTLTAAELTDLVKTTVNNYCGNYLISPGDANKAVTIDPIPDNCSVPGTPITVNVRYQYKSLVLPNLITDFIGTINLVGTTVMNSE
jgi:Flp pilus assembly protein TadG